MVKETDIEAGVGASQFAVAADAYVTDNSDMTIKEELEWVRGVIQGKLGILE